MKQSFSQSGPKREKSIELPPKREFLADYVLVYDEKREKTIYMASPDFHQFGHTWEYEGESFTAVGEVQVHTESPQQRWQGVYDVSREAVVAWNFGHDDDYKDMTYAVILNDDGGAQGVGGASMLKTSGDHPKRREDSEEVGGCFAYDRKREVTVCVTGLGVWELDASGTWEKKRGEDDLPTDENWRDCCFGGIWDPKSERTLFYWACEDSEGDDRLWLYAWDGSELELLSNEGMHDGLITGWMNVGPVLVSHPDGVVALCGWDRGDLIFDGAWKPWGASGTPRPTTAQAHVTWDQSLGGFVSGPGCYEPEKEAYPVDQHIFYTEKAGSWTKLGVTEQKSAISELWAKRFGAFLGGRWLMMGNTYLTLLEWTDDGWQELIGKKEQNKLWDGGGNGNDTHALVGMVETDAQRVCCVANEGQVFVLEGGRWQQTADIDKLWKKRMWTQLAWDPNEQRIVAWGGKTRGRKSNQALFFDFKTSKWKKAKNSSPQPKGYSRGKDEYEVEYQLYWDHGIGAVVRIGLEEAAVLEGEIFRPVLPPRMGELGCDTHRAIASDPKSGQTLIVNFETGVIFRFDLGGCEPLGSFEMPNDLRLGHTNEGLAYRVICDDWAFDAETRTLHTQNPDDAWGHYTLALAEFFDAAAKRGERTTADGVVESKSVALYKVDDDIAQSWFARTKASEVLVEEGAVGAEVAAEPARAKTPEAALAELDTLVASAKEEGYVTVQDLSKDQLTRLACVPMRKISLGGPASDAVNGSHLGGLPADAGLEEWPTSEREVLQQVSWHLPEELNFFEVPEADREEVLADLRDGKDPEPLGLLLQLDTGDLLKEHAGITVYVDTSGVATESMLHNRVRLIPKANWGRSARCESGTPALEARTLELSEPSWEVDEGRTTALMQRDPELGEALEALDLERSDGYSKMGGAPTWVQHPRVILGKGQVPYRFLMQLDFDTIGGLKDSWPDAGLFGVLYVFVSADESAACAFWQYT